MIDIEDKHATNSDEKVLETKQDFLKKSEKSNEALSTSQSSNVTKKKSPKSDAIRSSEVNESSSLKFKCELCTLEEACEYFGKSPPWSPRTCLLEDSYIMRDPFSLPQKKQILILGAKCTLCQIDVCVGARCSLFFSKRFCKDCALKNLTYFPVQVQTKIKKIFSR